MAIAAMMFVPTASAWNFQTTSSAKCDQATGEFVVSFSVNNTSEPEVLTVRESSRASVPVGSTVAERATRDFTERFPGTSKETVSLTISSDWPSHSERVTSSTSVTLTGDCVKPVVVTPQPVIVYVPVEVVREVVRDVVRTVTVPGPERIVEKIVEKPVVVNRVVFKDRVVIKTRTRVVTRYKNRLKTRTVVKFVVKTKIIKCKAKPPVVPRTP